jgi:enolase
MSRIQSLSALEILDSRGNPTIQVSATLDTGAVGIAKVPSGASTGKREAVELRDGDKARYRGKGVLRAVVNVVDVIQPAVRGMDASDQRALDEKLVTLDGTPNKSKLGANAILGVSIAVAKAAAADRGIPLYAYLGKSEYLLPVPMLNVLNGGRHADNNVDFQEFMVAPVGASCFSDALRAAVEVFHALKDLLQTKGYETAVGDEGGFAPRLRSNEEPLELLSAAVSKAGYRLGRDVAINLDPAASEFYDGGMYIFKKSDGSRKSSAELIELWTAWLNKYPGIFSLEDGLAEDDWAGWSQLTTELGGKVQLVGDDIFVTNSQILARGIREGVANSILIKLNQIGTVTETLQCIEMAQQNGYTTVISHRSGETDDTTIADFAVATRAGQLKTGSACRGERIAKYNRLLEIEKELGQSAKFAGHSAYEKWRK